eukprot:5590756-Pyramimonas_sp.AAC.2
MSTGHLLCEQVDCRTSPAACSMGTYTQALNNLSTEFQGPGSDDELDDICSEDSDLTMAPDTYDDDAATVAAAAREESEAYVSVRGWLYQQHTKGDNVDLVSAAAECVPAYSSLKSTHIHDAV